MQAHILQHVPFEGPGNIKPWLLANGYEITDIHLYKSEPLPAPGKTDLLIIMGGPMSVNDEAGFPWLVAEKQFIRSCIKAGKSVLGICLGSQLIASALGARVYRNHIKEIGWSPVHGLSSTEHSTFRFPELVEVFHWHGETFDLPPGAIRIARSEACENQAFQIGQHVIGLQFHLEATPLLLHEMVSHGRTDLVPSKYVQSEIAILAAETGKYQVLEKLMDKLLKELATPIQNLKFKI